MAKFGFFLIAFLPVFAFAQDDMDFSETPYILFNGVEYFTVGHSFLPEFSDMGLEPTSIACCYTSSSRDASLIAEKWSDFVQYYKERYNHDFTNSSTEETPLLETAVLCRERTQASGEIDDYIVVLGFNPGWGWIEWQESVMLLYISWLRSEGNNFEDNFTGGSSGIWTTFPQRQAISNNSTSVTPTVSASRVVMGDTASTLSNGANIDGGTDVQGTNNVQPTITAPGAVVTLNTTNNSGVDGGGASVTYNNETKIDVKVEVDDGQEISDSGISEQVVEEKEIETFSSSHDTGHAPDFVYIDGEYGDYSINWELLRFDIMASLRKVLPVEEFSEIFNALPGERTPSAVLISVCNEWAPSFRIDWVFSMAPAASNVVLQQIKTILSFVFPFVTMTQILGLMARL